MAIVINADDFGFTRGGNAAVFELARLGTVTSTTVMANMPYAGEAKGLLEIPQFTIGLHLNLTQGQPVQPPERVMTLVDSSGYFWDLKTLAGKAKKGQLDANEVDSEIEAQWETLRGIVGDAISHMDSHQGLNRIPFLFQRTLAFLRKRPLRAVRFYLKYYAIGSGASARFDRPRLSQIRRYGLRRLLVETYLKRQRVQLNRLAASPDGMLVSRSHDTRDLLRWLITAAPHGPENYVLEVPCHPAADTVGLDGTKYVSERVEEYELLKSPAFIEASRRWRFVDYTAVY